MRERKKMRGNDIQECDEYDKRNAVESPRARAHKRGILVYECSKNGITTSYFVLKISM